jgi:CheY-like chemotaxis protein
MTANAPTASRRVIVAADDDEDDIDLLRLLFRKAGIKHSFEVFRKGEEVIAALTASINESSSSPPLLCFLDVKMPAMNGLDILQWIRDQPALERLPVVMLSSSDHPADVEAALRLGAQCYLAKYPQPAVIQAVVAAAERYATGASANECFTMPSNLLRQPA